MGVAPVLDYTPFSLNDDKTRGGFERLGSLIAVRKAARERQGPMLVLDAGDYSMGTAFAAATRETGCELQLLSTYIVCPMLSSVAGGPAPGRKPSVSNAVIGRPSNMNTVLWVSIQLPSLTPAGLAGPKYTVVDPSGLATAAGPG